MTIPDDPAFAPYVLTDGLEYDGPLLLERARHELVNHELQELARLLERAAFWQMPANSDERGLDGAVWVVEARVDNSYHFVKRWSPPSGPFHDLGAFFFRVGRISRPLY